MSVNNDKYDAIIKRAAPTTFEQFKAQLLVESGLNPSATSEDGAKGIGQMLQTTFDQIKAKYSLKGDIYDPETNIVASSYYMDELLQRYQKAETPKDQYNLALAAYNTGMGNVAKYIAQSGALDDGKLSYSEIEKYLPNETKEYVKKVGLLGEHIDDQASVFDTIYKAITSTTRYIVGGAPLAAYDTLNAPQPWDGVVAQFRQRPILIPIYAALAAGTSVTLYFAFKAHAEGGSNFTSNSFTNAGKVLGNGIKTIKGIIK